MEENGPAREGEPFKEGVNYWPAQQKVQVDNTRRFKNMSNGIMALTITIALALCIGGPIALCFISAVVGAATDPHPTIAP